MTPAWLGADQRVEDRYALEALIGRGGMGEVWRARHLALDTRVAIKFLHGAAEPSERARRRFLTEARVTATLKTRYAVQVFDFGVTDDGLPYLVMELLEGDTLDKRIAREGRLSPATTARFLLKAARALEKAHALGIVHRDFKPENVMLVADEEDGGELVKVVDFGIAKLVGDLDCTLRCALSTLARRPGAPGAPRPAVPAGPLSSAGVGTPQYMAPEQVRDSAQVGPAADIWAFGVVAYECLTGRRPFDEPSVGELLRRVLSAAPPQQASAIAPIPPLFDDWFRVACAREPEDRFPDVQTAALALAAALDPAFVSPPARMPEHTDAALDAPSEIPPPVTPTLSSGAAPPARRLPAHAPRGRARAPAALRRQPARGDVRPAARARCRPPVSSMGAAPPRARARASAARLAACFAALAPARRPAPRPHPFDDVRARRRRALARARGPRRSSPRRHGGRRAGVAERARPDRSGPRALHPRGARLPS